MSVAETLGAELKERREQARKTYAEVLGRWDKPRPGDAEMLRGAMGELEISQADVDADLAARPGIIEREQYLLSEVERGKEVGAQLAAVKERAGKIRPKLNGKIARMQKRLEALYIEERDLESSFCRDAPARLEKYRSENWRFFGLERPTEYVDPRYAGVEPLRPVER